jgi:hypothetical protein
LLDHLGESDQPIEALLDFQLPKACAEDWPAFADGLMIVRGGATGCNRCAVGSSVPTENSLYVIAVRIEYEGRVVTLRVTVGWIAKPRRTIIGSARLERGRIKGVDLGAALSSEGRMLPHTVGMKAVNPEDRVLDTIADAISPIVLGNLHNPAEAERTKSGIVKSRRPANVGNADSCVVNHVAPSLARKR